MSDQIKSFSILGIKINAINLISAVASIFSWVDKEEKQYVCLAPAHAIMSAYHDPKLVNVYNRSGMTTPDGMAIVWILKLNGFKKVGRVYGPDLMQAVCEASLENGYSHYFYGGEAEVVKKLVQLFQEKYPGLNVVGYESPPFRPLSNEEEVDLQRRMEDLKPDILWVGIGSPKQEEWMSEHIGKLDVNVMVGVGAAFDFLSGSKKQAPKWIQRSGFEWLFRLFSEPKRLWRRYIQYPKFVFLVLLQHLGLIRFGQASGEGQ